MNNIATQVASELALELLKKLEPQIENLRKAVNDFIQRQDWLPGWALDELRNKWNELCNHWVKVFQQQENWLQHVGEVPTLRQTANSWQNDVASKVTGLPGHVSGGLLMSDDVFSGASANSYRGIIPAQTAAMTAVNTQYIQKITKGLNDICDAVNTHGNAFIEAIVALGAAVASGIFAVATSETVVGAVLGVIGVIGSLAIFVSKVHTFCTQLENDTKDIYSDWNAAANDWTGFDGQKWPQAVFAR